ncbi:MAG TPA: ribbon-helix-helix protein, CopG family [Anaerolineales bacterium]|nr:ribbon-helix-helix protein, CopG family [Anaerolineales bacterium]HMZ41655.1 ribbon-helix-helix protein, CopG family [Anaerolineales bacterium]HNB85809.1 ribbon-helix-helix protein, CopG family [Anaerolineales bacterium]HNO85846.1 ribbon-helix-helix protein, CopG family [Anaerolineales bacterium]
MQNLQRVNLLLEQHQREALEKLARQKNRSVSDLVREYIAAGLQEDNIRQRERLLALENARALKSRMAKRRKGKSPTKAVKAMQQIREERVNELLGRRR